MEAESGGLEVIEGKAVIGNGSVVIARLS